MTLLASPIRPKRRPGASEAGPRASKRRSDLSPDFRGTERQDVVLALVNHPHVAEEGSGQGVEIPRGDGGGSGHEVLQIAEAMQQRPSQ